MLSVLGLPDDILVMIVRASGACSVHDVQNVCRKFSRIPLDVLDIQITIDKTRTIRKTLFVTHSETAAKMKTYQDLVKTIEPIDLKNELTIVYPMLLEEESEDLPFPEEFPREIVDLDRTWGTDHKTVDMLSDRVLRVWAQDNPRSYFLRDTWFFRDYLRANETNVHLFAEDEFKYLRSHHGASCVENHVPFDAKDLTDRMRVRMRLVQNGVTCIGFDRAPRMSWTMATGLVTCGSKRLMRN